MPCFDDPNPYKVSALTYLDVTCVYRSKQGVSPLSIVCLRSFSSLFNLVKGAFLVINHSSLNPRFVDSSADFSCLLSSHNHSFSHFLISSTHLKPSTCSLLLLFRLPSLLVSLVLAQQRSTGSSLTDTVQLEVSSFSFSSLSRSLISSRSPSSSSSLVILGNEQLPSESLERVTKDSVPG